MTSEYHERRDVLRAVGGLAAAGTLAGCLSTGGETVTGTGGARRTTDDTATSSPAATERPGADGFEYGGWLPAPSAFEAERYQFGVLKSSALGAVADELGNDYYRSLVSGTVLTNATGIDGAAVDTLAGMGPGLVLAADFDTEAVASSLQEAGFEEAASVEGFDLWTPTTDSDYQGRAVGVADGLLIGGREQGSVSAREVAEATIDAGEGDATTYPESSDAVRALVDRLQSGQVRVGITREPPEETDPQRVQFAGNSGLGVRLSVEVTSTAVLLAFVFESERAADPGPVRTWIESSSGTLDYIDDLEVGTDGRVVTVDGTMATSDVRASGLARYFQSSGDRVQQNVQAGATIRVDENANSVTVTWTSNQNADHLTAEFDPEGGSTTTKRLDQVGDAVTYEGSDGETVTVTVVGHTGDQSTVIYQRTVAL